MKHFFALFCALCLCGHSFAASPSAQSVDRLLEVMEAQRLLDSMMQQMDGYIRNMVKQSIEVAKISNAERAKRLKDSEVLMPRMMQLLKEELSWDKMKVMYSEVYTETFTQEEVDGLIAFYESPVGKASVQKMPQATGKSMMKMQQIMRPLMERAQALSQELAQGAPAPTSKGKVAPKATKK